MIFWAPLVVAAGVVYLAWDNHSYNPSGTPLIFGAAAVIAAVGWAIKYVLRG